MIDTVLLSSLIGFAFIGSITPGPNNLMNIVTNRGRMQGFIILDYLPRAMEAIEALVGWVSAGDIVYEVDVQEGFDNIPSTLQRLYTGENFGKQLLKVADPEVL